MRLQQNVAKHCAYLMGYTVCFINVVTCINNKLGVDIYGADISDKIRILFIW